MQSAFTDCVHNPFYVVYEREFRSFISDDETQVRNSPSSVCQESEFMIISTRWDDSNIRHKKHTTGLPKVCELVLVHGLIRNMSVIAVAGCFIYRAADQKFELGHCTQEFEHSGLIQTFDQPLVYKFICAVLDGKCSISVT